MATLRFACLWLSFVVVPGWAEATANSAIPADLLVHSGTILTLDDANTIADTMVITNGRVVAVGAADLRPRYAPKAVLDLEGRTAMPGFIDTHVHISGKPERYIDLTRVTSIRQIQELVTDKAKSLPPGDWITGYGWSEDELVEQRRPFKADLDAAAPDNPVMLTRAGAHSAVVSSRALSLAGISEDTPDPEGGTIEHHEDGSLNGIIRERHEELVGHLVPVPENEELRDSLVEELQALFALGITSITEAMNTIDYYPEWAYVYAKNRGRLPRAAVQLAWEGAEAMAAFGKHSGDGDEHLRVGPVKIFADGGFTGPAAFTKQPYKGEAEYRGALNMPPDELRDLIRAAHSAGWQLGIHAIGDAAIELTVDYLAEALDAEPRTDHRHYLNHFTIMPGNATMALMADKAIAITQQPNFAYTLEGRYTEYLDGERLQHNNPMATPMKHGIHTAMSSDILPLGPWVGIYTAVTRKGKSGVVFGAEEKISRFDALRAYTSKGAYLTREEHAKGQLKPGMLADFIVLGQNPYEVDEAGLLNMQTHATYLQGRKVWPGAP